MARGDVSKVQPALAAMGSDAPGVESDQIGVASDQSEVEGDQSEVASDQSEVEGDQPEVEGDQPGVESDQPGVESDQPGVEGDQPELEGDQPGVESDQPGLEGDQPELEGDQPELEGDQPEVESDQPEVESDQPEVEGDQPEVEGDQPEVHGVFPLWEDPHAPGAHRLGLLARSLVEHRDEERAVEAGVTQVSLLRVPVERVDPRARSRTLSASRSAVHARANSGSTRRSPNVVTCGSSAPTIVACRTPKRIRAVVTAARFATRSRSTSAKSRRAIARCAARRARFSRSPHRKPSSCCRARMPSRRTSSTRRSSITTSVRPAA